MAADLVPIRLSLSDGDRYTVWAPRWRDGGDEWEAFLGRDEDDNGSHNQIPTVIYGAHVQPGTYDEQISHYNVLSTLEQMYDLPKTGNAVNAAPIATIWAP